MKVPIFFLYLVSLLISKCDGRREPALVPLRYDIQIQLPTASAVDPLIPTFFAALRLDFQITKPLFSPFRGYLESNARNRNLRHYNYYQRPLHPEGTELWFASRDLEGFENVTLTNDNRVFGIIDVRLEDGYVVFVIAEPALVSLTYF
jgi:hypothetical protein